MNISFYLYFNLHYVEDNNLYESNLVFSYVEHLNKYRNFDFLNLFKICTSLIKIELPSNLRNILKKLQTNLITLCDFPKRFYVLYKKYLSDAPQKLENIEPYFRILLKKIYIYIADLISKMNHDIEKI